MDGIINKYNPLLKYKIQKAIYNKGLGNKVLHDDGQFKLIGAASYAYKGAINVNTDFPLIAAVTEGDWYNITAATVTDNAGVLYTNTGTTWTLGQEIYWDGSTWRDYGLVKLTLTTNTYLVGDVLNNPTERAITTNANYIKTGANGELQQATVVANRILGNNTGSTAAPIDLTVAQVKTMLSLQVTVGTGGDYATFELALTANKYNLKLISNITLSDNIVLPSVNIYLDLNSYTITYGAFNFTVSATKRFYITGDCSTNFSVPFNNAVLKDNLINGNLSVTGNNANILNPFITGTLTNSGASIIVSNARVTGTATDSGTNTIKWEVN